MRKLLSTAVAIGIFTSTSLLPAAYADVAANALPVFDRGTNVEVTTNNNNMNIKIDPTNQAQFAVGTAYWDSFNIGKDATVNVEFTAHNQTSLNYVNQAGGMSQIYGNFTNSGCNGCGYAGTGKVILINPNGVLFGNGANVNLNSFTASNMNGTYTQPSASAAGTLTLTKTGKTNNGIIVESGAKIYGDKNVTLASDGNIYAYHGSQISTNTTALNVDSNADKINDTTLGKVKLVTADGVNFKYYNNAAVDQVSNVQSSTKAMTLSLSGAITSGHIDARNASTNAASELNVKNATLKAYKAAVGSDGNIWLTANNSVITEDSTFTTANATSAAANRTGGGEVYISSSKVSTLNKGNVNAVGNVTVKTTTAGTGNDAKVDATTINAGGDVLVESANIASIQNNSNVKGNNVTVKGTTRGQVYTSTVNANKDINVNSTNKQAWTYNSTLTAGQDVNIASTEDAAQLQGSTINATRNINVTTKKNIESAKIATSTFTAGGDINLKSTGTEANNNNVGNILLAGTEPFNLSTVNSRLNLTAAKNVQIVKDNALNVAKTNITAGQDVLLKSNNDTLTVDSTTKFLNAQNVYLNGKDVKTSGTVDMNNLKTNIVAANDVNVTLSNVGNADKGVIASAGNNMTITTPGTLSVSSLISGKDMTINANSVVKGKDYMSNPTLGGFTKDTTSSRSYIEVGGTFKSNVTNNNYVVTESRDKTSDGKYNQRHHIQYGSEKLYLVNKKPVENDVTDPTILNPDSALDIDVANPDNYNGGSIVNPDSGKTPTPYNPDDQSQGGSQGGGSQGGSTPQPGDPDYDCGLTGESDDVEDEQLGI